MQLHLIDCERQVKLLNQVLRDLIFEVSELRQWPELARVFPETEDLVRLDWQLPGIGYESVGGAGERVIPAMAALACVQISIILVDDMLDDEPDGEHLRLGVGRAANLSLALQAAAHLLMERCLVTAPHRAAAALSLNRMALATAAGQELDVRNLTGEENYWRVIRAKSTPFYGAGLEIGALLGGASEEVASTLYDIGVTFGEAIQIYDDLEDAFESPANSDWAQGRNNLVILYGLSADYPEKARFLDLRTRVDDLDALREAQQILIRSGAVSYCAFQLVQRHQTVRQQIRELGLASTSRLESLLDTQLDPFLSFLETIDRTLPNQLLETIKR